MWFDNLKESSIQNILLACENHYCLPVERMNEAPVVGTQESNKEGVRTIAVDGKGNDGEQEF